MKYKWPLIGHVKPLEQLEYDLLYGRLSHAYLFEGPAQIGKRTVARTLAQILQCENQFCRTCPTCKQIAKGQHIDTIELKNDGESIKIEEIRDLISHLSTTATHRYKIVIIPAVERLTPEAANALLKNLEEPLSNVIFILTSHQKQQLLDTLLSRVRVFSFYGLSEEIIRGFVNERRPDLDSGTLDLIAGFSMGKPGRALLLLEDPDLFRFYRDVYDRILQMIAHPHLTDRLILAEELHKNPQEIQIFMELFVHVVRGLLLETLNGGVSTYDFVTLFAMIEGAEQARFDLEHNVNSRLALENMLMTF